MKYSYPKINEFIYSLTYCWSNLKDFGILLTLKDFSFHNLSVLFCNSKELASWKRYKRVTFNFAQERELRVVGQFMKVRGSTSMVNSYSSYKRTVSMDV